MFHRLRSQSLRIRAHQTPSLVSQSRSATTMSKLAIDTKLRLKSGYDIPQLGFGVYQTPADVAEDVVSYAVKGGYRHVDSAVGYRNEQASVAGMLKPGIPRDQLFFTSKVPPRSINYKEAKSSVDDTLKKTGLDYVDLYLLHAPFGGRENRLGAWKALVEAVDEGKVRSIGVSNYGVQHLDELEKWQKEQPEGKAGILSVNQIELHPWLARPDIVKWCESRGVVLEAYSPLVRAQRMDEPVLKTLAGKHNKTPGEILLRWGLQKNFVILPKSVTLSRIDENKALYDFELSTEDMEKLNTGEYAPSAWDPTTTPLDS